MPDLPAGSIIKAGDFPPAQSDAQGDSYSATSTTYTDAISSGTYNDCGVAFTAPTSGRVLIFVTARCVNSGSTSGTLVAAETRTGSTIGSGTAVETADDSTGCSHYGSTFARVSIPHMLSGLTAGNSYNVKLLHRASASTATIAYREVVVIPLP